MKSERRVALVTGGAAGLGLAITRAFLKAQYDVLVVGRNPDRLDAATAELGSEFPSGARIEAAAGDISDSAAVAAVMQVCQEQFGRLDVLVNCVGESDRGTIAELSTERLEQLLRTNLLTALLCSQAALPMLRRSQGAVVNIGSLASKAGARYLGGYAIAKHALAGMTQQMRLELKPEGVHVALVCPGPIRRPDAGTRYQARLSESLPTAAAAPGAGAKLKGLAPETVADWVVRCAEQRLVEVILPRRVRILTAVGSIWPKLGDALLLRFTSSNR